MMTIEEKAKAYDEALAKSKEIKSKILSSHLSTESCKAVSEYIDEIIPELRESEDERIRKEVVFIVKQYGIICEKEGDPCGTINDCLEYLEKQKEPKDPFDDEQFSRGYEAGKHDALRGQVDAFVTEYNKGFEAGRLEGITAGYNKAVKEMEQKENPDSFTDEHPNIIYTEMGEEFAKQKEQNPTDEDEDRTINGCLLAANAEHRCKRASEELLEELGLADYTKFFYEQGVEKGKKEREKQKEQKPVEIHYPTDEEIESWRKELTEFKKFATKQAKENQLHISYTRDVMWENFCSELLSFVNSRKPVEWSEEDTEMYINVASSLRGYACGLENEEHKRHIKKGLDWLEKRFQSLRPVKQEWSEEDERILTGIIERGSVQVPPYTTALREEQIEWLMNRLKSLRPQPREEIYHAAKHDLAIRFMNYLDENRPEGKMGLSNGECEDIDKAFKENDWAKIMRYVGKYSPQPQAEWGEEDEKNWRLVLNEIKDCELRCWFYSVWERLTYHKPRWKPSYEQMEALRRTVNKFAKSNDDVADSVRLSIIYDNLKNL